MPHRQPTSPRIGFRAGLRGWAGPLAVLAVMAAATVRYAQAAGQNSPAGLPPNYNVIFENGAVEVIHVHYGPHEKVPMHDHSANPMPQMLRIVLPGAKPRG